MPIWPATGRSNGPKMISAAGPSRIEPMTIPDENRQKQERPGAGVLGQRDHRLRQGMGELLQRQHEGERLRRGDDESASPERVAALTKLSAAGRAVQARGTPRRRARSDETPAIPYQRDTTGECKIRPTQATELRQGENGHKERAGSQGIEGQ
jgi:hypothetical protein